MVLASSSTQLKTAWSRQYARLAEEFASLLPPGGGVVVEMGCGRGQLTVPLLELASRYRFVAVDSYGGPYAEDRKALASVLARQGLKERIRIVASDCLDWLMEQQGRTYVGAISSELLPELDSTLMGEYLSQCHRVLKGGGVAANSFLSPIPRNRRQALVIEADSSAKWTRFPPREWFSPPPDLVVRQMKTVGFQRIRTTVFPSNLRVKGAAALSLLRRWKVKPKFWESYEGRLRREGLEIPDWIVISGRRPR